LNSGLAQPPAGGDTGRTATDDRDLDNAVRHCEFLYLTERSPSKAMPGAMADGPAADQLDGGSYADRQSVVALSNRRAYEEP
jgi:hypothetical protein